jgi:hypothetical protein
MEINGVNAAPIVSAFFYWAFLLLLLGSTFVAMLMGISTGKKAERARAEQLTQALIRIEHLTSLSEGAEGHINYLAGKALIQAGWRKQRAS